MAQIGKSLILAIVGQLLAIIVALIVVLFLRINVNVPALSSLIVFINLILFFVSPILYGYLIFKISNSDKSISLGLFTSMLGGLFAYIIWVSPIVEYLTNIGQGDPESSIMGLIFYQAIIVLIPTLAGVAGGTKGKLSKE